MTLLIEKEVNPHFETFLFDWRCKTQVLVGGYGSSKSYHVALKIIFKLLEEKRTALVVREVYDTHRESTFSLFSEIIEDLGLGGIVKTSSSPMRVSGAISISAWWGTSAIDKFNDRNSKLLRMRIFSLF